MKLYGIGNALLYYREQKHLSQIQVCEGICPEMTLSRIETGEREFDSMILETLLERIGKTANRFEFVLNENSVLHEQFVLYYEAIIMEKENGSIQNIIGLLHEAINLTRPDYREKMLYPVLRFVEEMMKQVKQFCEENLGCQITM